MRRLLVTGGAGFIGSNFIHHWLGSHPGDRIVVLDKLTYAGNLENLKGLEGVSLYRFIRGDINDFNLLDSLFQEEKINVVVHFAAESHVDRSILGPKDFIETNINGTFTLLEVAKKWWVDTPTPTGSARRCFLHVSTDEVYGSLGAEGYFTEATPYTPNSPYSASKAASDHLVRAYHHTYGLPVITTNCSNNYGPYQFPEKLIPLMIINSFQGKPLPVYGDGLNIRDWLYVEDHCRAIDAVIQNGRIGETYNIGGGSEWKNIDIVNLLCDLADEMVVEDNELRTTFPFKGSRRELIAFVKDRPGHDRRYAIDCTKIEKELSWHPKETFETGIRKTIEWYVKNMPWWEMIISGVYRKYYQEQYGGINK
jgi:dTDP-glucose 4,6-dehydratase